MQVQTQKKISSEHEIRTQCLDANVIYLIKCEKEDENRRTLDTHRKNFVNEFECDKQSIEPSYRPTVQITENS